MTRITSDKPEKPIQLRMLNRTVELTKQIGAFIKHMQPDMPTVNRPIPADFPMVCNQKMDTFR